MPPFSAIQSAIYLDLIEHGFVHVQACDAPELEERLKAAHIPHTSEPCQVDARMVVFQLTKESK